MSRSTRIARRLGWVLIIASLALHFLTVLAYSRQPDSLAAFTVVPLWVWAGFGLSASIAAFLAFRAPLSLIVTAVWALTVLLGSDEAKVIANLGNSAPLPGPPAPHRGTVPLRVITLNCAQFRFGDPGPDLAAWQPDIVFIQEADLVRVQQLARQIFGPAAHYRAYALNGIASRFPITREVRNPHPEFRFFNHNATLRLPDGRSIELVNIHLSSAATDLSLWRPDCWQTHRLNRQKRRLETAIALGILEDTTDFPGIQPVIMAGDFNAPAADPIRRQWSGDFEDCFERAGTGWGNTFQRRVPILRLDRILVTRHFTPVRCRAVTTRKSDHRFVVADVLLD
ncbi:MAG: endonuclease/exonuclease/phosphatase family protein [Akkermansiaceae bacterium]|jgi:endonuclease/exonuclease/phosphatase (EEP) superfamily protein YafD|nr:endonuclease/exonuclease/phosphatase family protein [Akkermansiaceae bacterium]